MDQGGGSVTVSTNRRFSDKIRFIGHAGTESFAPGNTLEAYRVSSLMGMWGAECDLGITSDKELVLMHDETVDATTDGTGKVSDLTLSQIRELNVDHGLRGFTNVKVPTFREYLNVCKEFGLFPVIEVKYNAHTSGMADGVLSILDEYNLINDSMIISFGKDALSYIRNKNKQVHLQHILKVTETITDEEISYLNTLGNASVDVYGTLELTKGIIDKCHKAGISVNAWTVDTVGLQDHLINIGVDMITTNALIDKQREKKIFEANIQTIDNGVTWSSVTSPFRESATVTKKDDWNLLIEFPSYLKQAIAQFKPNPRVYNVSNNSIVVGVVSNIENSGAISVRFVYNNALVRLQEIPYTSLNFMVELVF